MAAAFPLIVTDPNGALSQNAPVLLHIRLVEMLRFARFVPDRARVSELHAMRIAAKRLRYTMEILAPAYDGPQKASFEAMLRVVKSIQDQIGQIHDCDFRTPMLQAYRDKYGPKRPRIVPGLERLIYAELEARDKLYADFVAFWKDQDEHRLPERLLDLFIHPSSGVVPLRKKPRSVNGQNRRLE